MNKKNTYQGLKNIIKDLDQQNDDFSNTTTKNKETYMPVQGLAHTWHNYAEYLLEGNDISVFWCYLEYTKSGQKCVFMVYKDPIGIEKIIVASLDMENEFELIEKVIDDLWLDTNLVTVVWWGKLTIETDQVYITDNDSPSHIGNIGLEDKNTCKSIIEQHIHWSGIENIHYTINEQILEVFNEHIDNLTKVQVILTLIQRIFEVNEMIYKTSDLGKIDILQKKIYRHRNILKQYHNSIERGITNIFPTRRNYIKELEALFEPWKQQINGYMIPLENKEAFMELIKKYWIDLMMAYHSWDNPMDIVLNRKQSNF